MVFFHPNTLDLSAPQNSPEGQVIRELYSTGFIRAMLWFEEYVVGLISKNKISLSLKMDLSDANAFLDLAEEFLCADSAVSSTYKIGIQGLRAKIITIH